MDIDFSLQFHLSYFAWRNSIGPREEARIGRNGEPLRKRTDITFLRTTANHPANSQLCGYIYEAQTSCLIAGWDSSRWVGYGFVDTYFDDESVRRDMRYYDSDDLPFTPDLIPGGYRDLSHSVRTPREYFLVVLDSRVAEVVAEWESVLSRISCGVSCVEDPMEQPLADTSIL